MVLDFLRCKEDHALLWLVSEDDDVLSQSP